MRKEKIVWQSVNIPKTLFKKIREFIAHTGNVSVAEYVRIAIEFKMNYDRELLEKEVITDV